VTRIRLAVAGVLFFAAVLAVWAAQIGNLNAPPVKQKSYVVYDAEQQVVAAGKRSVLELRFQVVDGFHVNSHTPKSELLIPTKLSFEPAAGVTAGSIEYPPGTSYSFSFDPANKLDVYSGAFTVKLPLTAKPGSHSLDGTLQYQACDHAACYPPKNLPVQVVLLAK
jgi:DsbC/DsbD-like thiol-disulfide interchange protein